MSSEPVEHWDAKLGSVGAVARSLHGVRELAVGEAAIESIAKILDMQYPCWVPDIANPYFCREMDAFVRSRGWPDELQQFWWDHHAALKMPIYIRCRLEHLPFVMTLDRGSHRRPQRRSSEHLRVNEILTKLGITTMLAVPLHLPKGQVAMLLWAGNRSKESLVPILGPITGDLLAVGHRFMRIYNAKLRSTKAEAEERARLTPKEWDCLRTLAQGYREAEVAEFAGIAKSTVRFHLDNVVQKFGCKNRAQAIAIAAQLGLLGPIGP